MHENYHLEKLTIAELYLLLGHIKLGVTHLRKHLSEEELTQLLAHGRIEPPQYQKIKADEYVEDTVRILSVVGHVSQNLALIDRQDVRST